jgi:hypothetical protein
MSDEPTIIPSWLSDEDEIAPCPCGGPRIGPIAVIKSERGLKTGYHYPGCLQLRRAHEELDEEDTIDWE